MLRPVLNLDEPDLERELLRRGVHARDVLEPRCGDCGRRPLIGETVHRYDREEICELCRGARTQPPSAQRIVLHNEHGVSVRRLAA